MKKAEKFFKNNSSGYNTTRINYSGYGYGQHYGGMTHLYGYDNNGFPFNYIVSYHRACQIIKLIKNKEWWEIDEDIRNNYSTNGYTTRIGLKRANIKRCKQIAESHIKCDYSGKSAHDYRVRLRN